MTICVECKYEFHVINPAALRAKECYFCQAPAVALPLHPDPVTGRQVHGQECTILPWPPCETINHGNCPHFEAKS